MIIIFFTRATVNVPIQSRTNAVSRVRYWAHDRTHVKHQPLCIPLRHKIPIIWFLLRLWQNYYAGCRLFDENGQFLPIAGCTIAHCSIPHRLIIGRLSYQCPKPCHKMITINYMSLARVLKIPLSGIDWYQDLSSLCCPTWFQPLPFPEVVFSEISCG